MNDFQLATIPDALLSAAVDHIVSLGDDQLAALGNAPTSEAPHRSCRVQWIGPTQSRGLYEHISRLLKFVNEEHFQYELSGIAEPFQYAVYEVGSFFDWHQDARPGTIARRSLSLTIQLSDSKDYDGGDLIVKTWTQECKGNRDRGTMIAFPAHLQHKVTPVTRGVRKSLVIWGAGFR